MSCIKGHTCPSAASVTELAACAMQDPADVLTDARARIFKVWADIDEDLYRREAALPFRVPGPRCDGSVCAPGM